MSSGEKAGATASSSTFEYVSLLRLVSSSVGPHAVILQTDRLLGDFHPRGWRQAPFFLALLADTRPSVVPLLSSARRAREKSQEAMFVRQREMEKLAALRKQSEADIKAQEEKIVRFASFLFPLALTFVFPVCLGQCDGPPM